MKRGTSKVIRVLVYSGLILSLTKGIASRADTVMPYEDGSFGCIDANTADKYTKDFNINIQSFGGKELCNSNVDTKKLFNDLQIVEFGQFNTTENHLLIKGFIPSNQYYGWLKSQTRGIERGDDIPFATAYNSGGYFTMQDGWAQLSTLGRVGTVIHEARHTQGYVHISCTHGPYANTRVSGCDKNYSYGGSHAIEMEYYARVSTTGINFHPVYRSMARLMATARSNFVFNQSPILNREALVLQDTRGGLSILDSSAPENSSSVLGRDVPSIPNYANYFLKTTSFGAVLFSGLQAIALDVYQRTGFPQPIKDDYSYYKLLVSQRGQGTSPIIDFEEYDYNNLRSVVLINKDHQIMNYDFQNGKFANIKQSPNTAARFATVLSNGTLGLFIIGTNSELYSVNPQNASWTKLDNVYWPENVAQIVSFKGKTLTLKNGFVFDSSAGNALYGPLSSLSIRQMVKVPLYNAFDVRKD